jgi:hypothetical protein
MPYAVFSKRTGIVSRIVHDLASLLPSESMIEVTDDVAFPRRGKTNVIGQQINTNGLRLFDEGGGVPTIKPYKRVYNATTDRAEHVKFEPLFISAVDLNGDPIEEFVDIPIYAHPYAWTADELAQVKYESILAENYPYQVVIGEEFLTTDHIDSGNSSDYILSEGKCMLSPGGILQTVEFKFNAPKRVASTPSTYDAGMQYVFDTYYFSTEPEFPEGVIVSWDGRKNAGGALIGTWQTAITDDEMPTTEDGAAVVTPLTSMIIRIQNLTSDTFEIENYMLFLRLRNVP